MKFQLNNAGRASMLTHLPGEEREDLGEVKEVRELYLNYRKEDPGLPPVYALMRAKKQYLMEQEFTRKGVTAGTYRMKCRACGRTGQAHIFDNTCKKFQMTDIRIDLDEVLNHEAPKEKVQAWFRQGDWDEEHYLVDMIKMHLLTPEQREALLDADHDLSIEDILNGRVREDHGDTVTMLFHDWNTWLGFYSFGYDGSRQGEPYPPELTDLTDEQLAAVYTALCEADRFEVEYEGGEVVDAASVEFRPHSAETDGSAELIVTDSHHEDECGAQVDGDEMRRMKVKGNVITVVCNDGDTKEDGTRDKTFDFRVTVTLYKMTPHNITTT